MLRSNQPDIKSLIIREVHEGDGPILNRLFPKGIPEIHHERIQKQLDRNAVYLIAIIHGKPVGHVLLHWDGAQEKEVREKMDRCPSIEDLFVDHLYRSRGIGTELLNECAKRVRQNGFSKMGLAVGVINHKAKQFYHEYGFTDAGVGEFWVEWPIIDKATGQRKMEGEMCRYLIKHI